MVKVVDQLKISLGWKQAIRVTEIVPYKWSFNLKTKILLIIAIVEFLILDKKNNNNSLKLSRQRVGASSLSWNEITHMETLSNSERQNCRQNCLLM